MKDRANKFLLIIILTGLVLRILHLRFFLGSPLAVVTSPDELYHHLWASRIAEGSIIPEGIFFRAPLYPYLLSIFYWIFGATEFVGRLPGLICGIFTIFVAYKLTRKLAGSDRAGLIAALLFAVNPIIIYFESRLLLDFLLVPFAMLSFYYLILWGETKNQRHIFFVGLFAGLFAITRPTILPIFALFFVYSLFKEKLRPCIFMLLGFIIPIMPVFISNLANGSATIVASQGGVNFYIGNYPQSDGISAALPELGFDWQYRDAARLARAELGKAEMNSSEVSQYYFRKGVNFWKRSTSDALTLFVKKIYLAFDGVFLGNNGDISFFRRYSPILWIPNISGILFAIGIFAGLFYSRKNRFVMMLFLYALMYGCLIAVFFVNTRFRLPMYAAMIPLSALYINEFISDTKILTNKPAKFLLMLFLLFLLSVDFIDASKSNTGSFHFTLGNSYLTEGDIENAEQAFHDALEADPRKRGANLNLGLIEYKRQDYEKAIEYYAKEVRVGGEVAKAYSNIGLIQRLQGNAGGAIRYGKKAIGRSGDLRDAYYNLAMTFSTFGMFDSSTYYAGEGVYFYPGDIRLTYALANSYHLAGDHAKAKEVYQQVIDNFGREFIESYDFGSAIQSRLGKSRDDRYMLALTHYNLSVVCGNAEDFDGMRHNLLRTIQADPTFTTAYIQLGSFYLAFGKPDSALIYYDIAENLGSTSSILNFNKAVVLSQLHRFHEARDYFTLALDDSLTKHEALEKLTVVEQIIEQTEEKQQ